MGDRRALQEFTTQELLDELRHARELAVAVFSAEDLCYLVENSALEVETPEEDLAIRRGAFLPLREDLEEAMVRAGNGWIDSQADVRGSMDFRTCDNAGNPRVEVYSVHTGETVRSFPIADASAMPSAEAVAEAEGRALEYMGRASMDAEPEGEEDA